MHADALQLSPHKVITLSPHKVKVGGTTGFTDIPETAFSWICYTSHPCSGLTRFRTDEQQSHQWEEAPIIGGPDPGVWDEWAHHVYEAMWGVVTVSEGYTVEDLEGGQFGDWLNSDERYLVTTQTARATSPTVGGDHPRDGCDAWWRYIRKVHKHTNTAWYLDYRAGTGDGSGDVDNVTWDASPIYHWEIDEAGNVTESGNSATITATDWFQKLLTDNASTLFPSGFTYTAGAYGIGAPLDVYSTVGALGIAVTANMEFVPSWSSGYGDPENIVFAVTHNWSMSNEVGNPWSVDDARQACDELSALVHFEQGNREYPDTGGTAMDQVLSAPYYAESITLVWLPPDSTPTPMRVSYTFDYPSEVGWTPPASPGWDGTIPFPLADGDTTPVCSNWVYTGASPGEPPGYVKQMKTLIRLPNITPRSYQRKSLVETPSSPGTNAAPSPGPEDTTEYNGVEASIASEFIASVGGGLQYFKVPEPWRGNEIIRPMPE